MDTIYRKVEIKSEQDLPKEKDKYFVKLKHGIRTVCNFHSRNHKIWMERVEYYLQPIEPQEPKCEECPSKQFYEANTAKIMDKIEQEEDFPEIDFREQIANELTRDELIERLCEMHKLYTEMRKEWFNKTQIESVPVSKLIEKLKEYIAYLREDRHCWQMDVFDQELATLESNSSSSRRQENDKVN